MGVSLNVIAQTRTEIIVMCHVKKKIIYNFYLIYFTVKLMNCDVFGSF